MNDNIKEMETSQNKIIGTIFRYYRSSKKLSRFEASLLSKKKNIYLSESTIKRIENKNLKNNSSTLNKYAQVFSKYYDKNKKLYIELNLYKTKIINFVKKNETLKNLEIIYKELLKFNSYHNKAIYLSEISRLLISVLEDYLYNKKISFDEQRIYEFIVDNVDDDDELIVFMYYLLYKSYLFERGKTEDNLSKIKAIILKANFNKIFYLEQVRFDLKDTNIVDLYIKYKNVYISCKEYDRSNIARLVTSLFNIAYCDIALNNFLDAENHLKEIFDIKFLNEYIPKYAIYSAYNLLGFVYFNLRKYEQAYLCFNNSRKQGGNSISFNFLLMFMSLEKINKVSIIKRITKEELDEVKLPVIKNIIIYYNLKCKNVEKKTLEEHIVKYLNKKELIFEPYSELMYEELFGLVKETKHYKYLYDFLKDSNDKTIF